MGKLLPFKKPMENEAPAADIVKAIKDAFTDKEIEAIRLELEGYDETDNEPIN